MVDNLATQTGHTAEEWADALDEAGVDGFTAAIDWLKAEHGLGHFQARLVAEVRRDR